MDKKELKKRSKFLSYILRHNPADIGIELDDSGWVNIETLLEALKHHGREISKSSLEELVNSNDKQRFAFSDDGLSIRANQGHSIQVQLDHQSAEPPEYLLHGTPLHSVNVIKQEGLKKMQRHDVHLHIDKETAISVGGRRGKPVLLRIRSREMAEAGYQFAVTPNQVWLTQHVPPEFIEFPAEN